MITKLSPAKCEVLDRLSWKELGAEIERLKEVTPLSKGQTRRKLLKQLQIHWAYEDRLKRKREWEFSVSHQAQMKRKT